MSRPEWLLRRGVLHPDNFQLGGISSLAAERNRGAAGLSVRVPYRFAQDQGKLMDKV